MNMNTTSPQNLENSSSDPLPWGHGPYSTKRFGTSLTNCDSEPVQSPGCIQSHGALITCRLADLCILQVSENSAQFLGLAPGELLSQPLTTLLAPGHLQTLQRMLIDEGLEANPRTPSRWRQAATLQRLMFVYTPWPTSCIWSLKPPDVAKALQSTPKAISSPWSGQRFAVCNAAPACCLFASRSLLKCAP